MKTKSVLQNSFLFLNLNEDTLDELLRNSPPVIRSFKRGDLVYSSVSECTEVGFILSGRCEIRLDKSDKGKTVLNVLGEKDSFGILSVYSADSFPTKIYATKNSEIIFFSANQIKSFVNNHSQISSNLIAFLANRISFLNHKIVTFSGTRVENRLAAFLLLECERHGVYRFPFNALKTGEEINAGRASVYRALSSLEESGLISFDSKIIHIIDPIGLERMKK